MRFGVFLFACTLLAGDAGIPASIAGGTVPGIPARAEGRMRLTRNDALLFSLPKGEPLRIPYDKVHTLEYGQRVHRRYAEGIIISPVLLLSKSRKHFVTIGYTDAEGNRQALVFRLGKHDVRAVLAGLEAKTGRRVEYQDDEARRSGRD
jgi:hypothetical protein